MTERLLSDREVSHIVGRARSTLQKDRVNGTGIPFVRLGALVRYRVSDLDAYLAALPSRSSTSEANGGVRDGSPGRVFSQRTRK